MELYFVRHGKTRGNGLMQYIGSTDEPLSEEGLAAANAVTPDLSVKEIFVSPLKRTQQTAAILFPEAAQTVIDGFAEMDFGIFEGRSADDMKDDAEYTKWVDSFCELPIPGGESRAQFQDRCVETFINVMEEPIKNHIDRVYFAVHGGTIMSILSVFAKDFGAYYDWAPKNLEGWKLTLAEGNDDLPFTLTDPVKITR
ncbi:MAG: histidine phosphatase family protein [Parasporobacterium sp.]|nr:histidine phosphatase family protein [Parasporobacterium sp.]